MINKDPIFDKMKNFLKIFQVPHVNDLSPTKKRKGFLKSCFSIQHFRVKTQILLINIRQEFYPQILCKLKDELEVCLKRSIAHPPF